MKMSSVQIYIYRYNNKHRMWMCIASLLVTYCRHARGHGFESRRAESRHPRWKNEWTRWLTQPMSKYGWETCIFSTKYCRVEWCPASRESPWTLWVDGVTLSPASLTHDLGRQVSLYRNIFANIFANNLTLFWYHHRSSSKGVQE